MSFSTQEYPAAASLRLAIKPDLAEMSKVREFVGKVGTAAGLSPDRVFDLQVVVSEAAANGIEHAASAVEIEAWPLPDRIILEVTNDGSFLPGLYKDDNRRRRGLGLPLMVSLADQMHVTRARDGGTRVSLTFFLAPAQGPGHGATSASPDTALRQLEAQTMKLQSLSREREELLASLSKRYAELEASHRELEKRQRRLRLTQASVDGSGDIITWVTADGSVFYFSDSSARRYGYSREEMASKSVFDIDAYMTPQEWAPHWEELKKLRSMRFERIHVTKDGERFPVEVTANYLELGGQAVNVAYIRDITQRKQAERALRESEERLKRSQELAHLGSWEFDLAHDELIWSDEVYRIFGLEPQEFGATYGAFLEHVHPDDRTAVNEAYFGSIAEGRDSYEMEHRAVRHHTGEVRWIHEKCTHIRDEDGRIVRSLGMVLDITERKEADEKRRRSEQRLSEVVRHVPLGLLEIDYRGPRFINVNQVVCDLLGYSEQELLEMSPLDLLDEKGRQLLRSRMEAVLREETISPVVEYRIRAKDGREMDALLSVTPISSEDRPYACSVVAYDITERKCAEEALAEAHARARADLEAMSVLRRLGELAMKEQQLELVFLEVVDAAIAIAGGDYGTIQLVNEQGDLSLAAYRGLPQLWVDFCSTVPRGVGACGTALAQGKRMIVEDIEQSPLFVGTPGLDIHRRSGVQAVQATPLVSRSGRELGMFSVYYKDVHCPDERELGLLDLLARQVADVIERARAEESLRQGREKDRALAKDNERLYRQQLGIAESIQNALFHMPSEIGPIRVGHLYRSATETARIGGDFYDIFPMRNGKIAIVIGDVSGHGIEAARLAALTKDVMHAFAHLSVRPQRILENTNELLLEKSLGGFVTVFLGILDTESLRLRYASAGHPRPLLRRKSGDIEPLRDGSPPLGVDKRTQWRVDEVDLEPGDLLFLYTDGVIEARKDGELFGEERLEALLKRKRPSVGHLPARLLDQVLAFSDGALQDDIAVLSMLITTEDEA